MIRVVKALWTTSLLTGMQYRSDFIFGLAMTVAWGAWSVIPLFLVFEHTSAIEGWTYPEAMLVMSFFLALRGLVDGFIEPNLHRLVLQIREGTLDFVLLKPADAQLLVSVQRVVPGRLADLLGAIALGIWSLRAIDHQPTAGELFGALVCLISGVLILYSLWLMAASTAFWWVRVDSLSHLLGAILDAGRWPISVYRGWLKAAFTFVLPVALMTSYPAMALRGALTVEQVALAGGLGVGFALLSRRLWRFALSHYTSASS
ncbi:MAG: ABC transporter permease [Bradymonadia bacterium]